MEFQCKLPEIMCGQKCSTFYDLVQHTKTHLKDGLARVPCPFIHCNNVYDKIGSFCSHLSRTHSIMSNIDYDEDIDSDNDIENQRDAYLKHVALFYLKLQVKHLIPNTTIQNILEDIEDMNKISKDYLTKLLRKHLSDIEMENEPLSYGGGRYYKARM